MDIRVEIEKIKLDIKRLENRSVIEEVCKCRLVSGMEYMERAIFNDNYDEKLIVKFIDELEVFLEQHEIQMNNNEERLKNLKIENKKINNFLIEFEKQQVKFDNNINNKLKNFHNKKNSIASQIEFLDGFINDFRSQTPIQYIKNNKDIINIKQQLYNLYYTKFLETQPSSSH